MEINWKAETRKVVALKNWEKNPRKITKEAFEKIKDRITKRGMHDVIKLDTEDNVLSGNQRKRALMDLGIEEVNVLVPSRPLTEKEKQEIILESNLNDGIWDFDILGNEFDVQTLQDIGFPNMEMFLGDENTDFDLPSGEKGGLEQITFTLSADQATQIKDILSKVKETEEYKALSLDQNSNSNGNALFVMSLICQQNL